MSGPQWEHDEAQGGDVHDAPTEGMNVARIQPSAVTTQGQDTAAVAVAAAAVANVKARYAMAIERPRSWAKVRQDVLFACRNPRFADKARYTLPRGGKKIVGLTIRFAEELARCMGNIIAESTVTFDGPELRIVKVVVTDLENNLNYPIDIAIAKTVERNSVKDGAVVIRERTGSQGQAVFVIAATDDDLMMKQNSLVSKAIRTGVLRITPFHLIDEANELIVRTMNTADAKDPGAAAKKIADSFFALGIGIQKIEDMLGHPIAKCTPEEVQQLREYNLAVKDEDVKWEAIVALHKGVEADAETKAGVEAVKNAIAQRALRQEAKAKSKGEKKDDDPPDAAQPAIVPPPPPAPVPASATPLDDKEFQ